MVDTQSEMEVAPLTGPGAAWLLGFVLAAPLLRVDDLLLMTGSDVSRVRRTTHAGR